MYGLANVSLLLNRTPTPSRESTESFPKHFSNPAVVSWLNASHQTQYLCPGANTQSRPVIFSIDYSSEAATVLFKIRLPIGLKTSSNTKTHLFLFIHPEQVTSLTHHGLEPDETPEQVRQKLGHGVICLKFQLSTRPDMIVPKSFTPKKREDCETLDALKQLARQTALSIYVGCDILPDAQARIICDIALDPEIRTSCLENHLTTVYGSNRVRRWLCSEDAPAAPPPSYNQAQCELPLVDEKGKTLLLPDPHTHFHLLV